jgi:hypothetical protein
LEPNTLESTRAECHSNEHVVGGGYELSSPAPVRVVANRPKIVDGTETWLVTVVATEGASPEALVQLTAYAVCGSLTF